METKILSGTQCAKEIRKEIRLEAASYLEKGLRQPKLVVILAGNDPASEVYVRNKNSACEKVGFLHETILFPEEVTQEEILQKIDELNHDDTVDGILVQMPVPEHLDQEEIKQAVIPHKDVDGFNYINAGKVAVGDFEDAMIPCTPWGVIELLKRNDVEIAGKKVVIVGRSNLVGKPEMHLMLKENATVTICHSKTEDMPSVTKQADILVAAVGRPGTITADMVKEGAVLVDVGINRTENGLTGDIMYEDCLGKASAMTPVPGGVGPMTIAMLLKNTLKAYKLHIQ